MKINLLAIFLVLSVCSTAQIQKGTVMIGGDLSASFNKTKSATPLPYTVKSQGYNISPAIGWAIKDNVILGGRLIASFSSYDQVPNSYSKNKQNALGAGVWMRKYFPLGKSFYFFANTDLNGNSNYRKQTDNTVPLYYYKETGFSINAFIYPGISYQVKKNFFLDASLNNLVSIGYTKINMEQNNQDGTNYRGSNNSFSINSSLGAGVPLQLGLRWLISKK